MDTRLVVCVLARMRCLFCTTDIALCYREAGRYYFRTELDIHNLISEQQQRRRQLTTVHSSDLHSCSRNLFILVLTFVKIGAQWVLVSTATRK